MCCMLFERRDQKSQARSTRVAQGHPRSLSRSAIPRQLLSLSNPASDVRKPCARTETGCWKSVEESLCIDRPNDVLSLPHGLRHLSECYESLAMMLRHM